MLLGKGHLNNVFAGRNGLVLWDCQALSAAHLPSRTPPYVRFVIRFVNFNHVLYDDNITSR